MYFSPRENIYYLNAPYLPMTLQKKSRCDARKCIIREHNFHSIAHCYMKCPL